MSEQSSNHCNQHTILLQERCVGMAGGMRAFELNRFFADTDEVFVQSVEEVLIPTAEAFFRN